MADLFADEEIKKMLRAFAGEPFQRGREGWESGWLEKRSSSRKRELEARGERREGWVHSREESGDESRCANFLEWKGKLVQGETLGGCCCCAALVLSAHGRESKGSFWLYPSARGTRARSFALQLPQSRILGHTHTPPPGHIKVALPQTWRMQGCHVFSNILLCFPIFPRVSISCHRLG